MVNINNELIEGNTFLKLMRYAKSIKTSHIDTFIFMGNKPLSINNVLDNLDNDSIPQIIPELLYDDGKSIE